MYISFELSKAMQSLWKYNWVPIIDIKSSIQIIRIT